MAHSFAAPPSRGEGLPRLLRRLALKPYGDELLTRSGDFWIFSARLIILTMALAEAIAWGYMGSLISRAHPLIAGVFAGAIVFTLIWIIDATFMTLDVSRAFYEGTLTGRETDPRKEKLKVTGGVFARVAIVTASLFITAPFLAQAIFAGDVDDEMRRRNSGAVASKRQELEKPFVSRIESLQNEQRTLEQERVKEAAGTGMSGKYGRGPALETIERQLSETRNEIGALQAARASALSRFDALSRPQLEQQYGLAFVAPGVRSSAQVLDGLRARTDFADAEIAIRAFLAFLFAGLLILKLFQPRSIAIYFNEQLHSVYDDYRKGLFDSYLPGPQRATAGGSMDPLRFEDWCVNTYATIRKDDERRRDSARDAQGHILMVDGWQRLETSARGELEPLARRLDEALTSIDSLEREVHEARTAAESSAAELNGIDAVSLSMLQQIEKGSMDGPTFARAIAAQRELEERRRNLSLAVKNAEAAIASLSRRLEARRSEATRLREEIAGRESVIVDAQKRIADERIRFAAAIGRHG